jgi:hypothetical protein
MCFWIEVRIENLDRVAILLQETPDGYYAERLARGVGSLMP